jgi:hypothetical protein
LYIVLGGTGGDKLSSVAGGGNFATEFDVVGGIISGRGTKKYEGNMFNFLTTLLPCGV